MIRRIVHIVLIFLCSTLQISWALWLGYLTPELVLAVILALSMAGDIIDSLWWIVLGGLMLDLISGGVIGFHLLLFVVYGTALITLNRQVFHQPSPMVAIGIFFVASLLERLISGLIFGQVAWQIILPATITAILALLVYALILVVGTKRQEIHFG